MGGILTVFQFECISYKALKTAKESKWVQNNNRKKEYSKLSNSLMRLASIFDEPQK